VRNNDGDFFYNKRNQNYTSYKLEKKQSVASSQHAASSFKSSTRFPTAGRPNQYHHRGPPPQQHYHQQFRPVENRNKFKLESRRSRSRDDSYPRYSGSSDVNHQKPNRQSSGGRNIDRSKDAEHFEFRKGQTLYSGQGKDPKVARYTVVRHLGDGTFGRCLKCVPVDGDG